MRRFVKPEERPAANARLTVGVDRERRWHRRAKGMSEVSANPFSDPDQHFNTIMAAIVS
jgi:hypothetical protein